MSYNCLLGSLLLIIQLKIPSLLRVFCKCETEGWKEKATNVVVTSDGRAQGHFCDTHYKRYLRLWDAARVQKGVLSK